MTNEAQSIIDAATRAATPAALAPGRWHTVVVPDGSSLTVLDGEERDAPLYKRGVYRFLDGDSLVRYVRKHGHTGSETWIDSTTYSITAVLDANMEATPGRERHRAVFQAQLTEAWQAWAALDGKLLSQTEFAEHIEGRDVDVIEPTSADMLELAQSFKATTSVTFEASKRLSDGQRQFEYRESIDAKAGRAGRLDIPEAFSLALRPFEGAAVFKVRARLRYRLTEGALRIGYALERPEDILREAFGSVADDVGAKLAEAPGGLVLAGRL